MPVFAVSHMNIPQPGIFDAALKISDEYPQRFFMGD